MSFLAKIKTSYCVVADKNSITDALLQISQEINRLWNKEDDLFIKLEDEIKNALTLDISPFYTKRLETILKILDDRINSYPELISQIRGLSPFLAALRADKRAE